MKLQLLGLLAALSVTWSTGASAQLPYPDIVDASHASKSATDFFQTFFTEKSLHQPDEMMKHFTRGPVSYIDVTSGGNWPSWDALNTIFHGFLTKPATALSYPLRIYGDNKSALVFFTDTPELFGRELRVLGAVNFDNDGKIIRWMDYWDGRSSNVKNTLKPTYPTDFHDEIGTAAPRIQQASERLEKAFSDADASAATALFTPDAVYEDLALHTQILGRLAIGRYLTRALPKMPYGKGAMLAHVVGGDQAGGYEWRPLSSFPMRRGILSFALDEHGLISHLTTVYDSSLMADADYQSLVLLSAEQ